MKCISAYQLLANCIIKQAARDYQQLLCHKSVEGASIKECQNFFNGDDFKMMTKLDGPTLMHQLEAEAEKYKYDWEAIRKAHGEED